MALQSSGFLCGSFIIGGTFTVVMNHTQPYRGLGLNYPTQIQCRNYAGDHPPIPALRRGRQMMPGREKELTRLSRLIGSIHFPKQKDSERKCGRSPDAYPFKAQWHSARGFSCLATASVLQQPQSTDFYWFDTSSRSY